MKKNLEDSVAGYLKPVKTTKDLKQVGKNLFTKLSVGGILKAKEGTVLNIKGDNTWDYMVKDDKYFTKKKGNNKWLDITNNKQAVQTINQNNPLLKNEQIAENELDVDAFGTGGGYST